MMDELSDGIVVQVAGSIFHEQRGKIERLRNALRDILCITQENYHTGCTCFSCTAYEIARKALEG